jgi:hypothetical protein
MLMCNDTIPEENETAGRPWERQRSATNTAGVSKLL